MKAGIKTFANNPTLDGFAELLPELIYSEESGEPLKLKLLLPWRSVRENGAPRPLIVFVQGSAWTSPNTGMQLPQLSELAREGFAVATLTHRNALEGHPFPAYLLDVKAGIRYLRKNAKEYAIDPDRVALWGTSSGGNTALLVGLTGDDPRYETGEHRGFSDAVQAVVDCFGPSNLMELRAYYEKFCPEDQEMSAIVAALRGDAEPLAVMRAMSPILEAVPGKSYPPFLLAHGDADPVVPFEQSEKMLERLLACGARARLLRVAGAGHEGSFWSRPLFCEIVSFLRDALRFNP